METVEIKYIDFENYEMANLNENYPSSGLFITRIKDEASDLRFIDKSIKDNYCVTPEYSFNKCCKIIREEIKEASVIDKDFVLEFSKILLNKK